ncbi:hypothetical protein ALC57_05406 [Trachymyrmex cornetzi]|uniref:C2H2-type domain-containing protein n=1 Tax=Trachymyrmex cornetzi TaxID=471704 RepID=A0A151JAR7_9HYME|nr:hypothetical protein ALC57_05406 [Trachymyrmex cornetzi]
MEDLLNRSKSIDTVCEYLVWEQKCDECLDFLSEECRKSERCQISTGVINSSIVRIAQLEGMRNTLRQRFAHADTSHAHNQSEKFGLLWLEIETAFKRRILTGVTLNSNYIEPQQFSNDARDIVFEQIRDNHHQRHICLKVNTIFNGEFIADVKRAVKSITTKNYELCATSDLREWYDKHVTDSILTSLEEFQERDSGWALSRILNLIVNVNKYNPMRVGCCMEIPRCIKLKKAVINIHSMDNACFAWSIVAALYPSEKNKNRLSSYPHYKRVLNLTGIEFPVTLKQISKFELLNDISVNIFTERERSEKKDDNGMIVPLRLTKDKKDKHVNLLYLQDVRGDNNTVGHFVWIKNLSRLIGSQINKTKRKKYLCDRCLHYFYSSEKLSLHIVDCASTNDCAIILPKEDNKWLSFNNHNMKRLPFVVSSFRADLECILEKRETSDENISRFTCQHHKVFSVAYYMRCAYDESLSMYRSHRGEDCVSWFKELYDLAYRVKMKHISNENISVLKLTSDEGEKFYNATHCHICEKPFEVDDLRVRDHCHLTGRFRGAAHSYCNLIYKKSCIIPIFFHTRYLNMKPEFTNRRP